MYLVIDTLKSKSEVKIKKIKFDFERQLNIILLTWILRPSPPFLILLKAASLNSLFLFVD